MSKNRIKPEDIITIPADETIKLVFAADKEALIQFINAVFGKTYNTATERFTVTNADFVDSQTFDRIHGDLMFSIEGDYYHLEFQTAFDSTLTIRIFEYGASKALEIAKSGAAEDPVLFVFPQPLIIYLEYDKNITSQLNAVLKVPGHEALIPFVIQVIKMYEYSAQDLIDREWYLLLPFTLIAHRKTLDLKRDSEQHKKDFINAFRVLLDTVAGLTDAGKVSAYLSGILIGSVKHLASYFNEKYIQDDEFGKEVMDVKQGSVRTFLDDVRDEGREEVREEERQKQEEERKITALKMLKKGYAQEDIIDIIGISQEELQALAAS